MSEKSVPKLASEKSWNHGRNAEGLGKLNYDARRGMYLHPTLMVTPERLSLGITDA
ncbi:hypothetical protein GCM10007082_02570 [Oceanisphaera arctica]|nr:hypothetical protein GCM10007082_02570 [Oceanisphaera arctica]